MSVVRKSCPCCEAEYVGLTEAAVTEAVTECAVLSHLAEDTAWMDNARQVIREAGDLYG